MKREWDDMQEWMTLRDNRAGPFFYTYPELPPRFRRWCGISRFLCLAGFWTGGIAALGLLMVGVLHWLFGRPASDGTLAVFALLSGLSFLLWWVFRLADRIINDPQAWYPLAEIIYDLAGADLTNCTAQGNRESGCPLFVSGVPP